MATNGKKRKSKTFYILVSACLLLCLAVSGVSIFEFQTYNALYHHDMSLARIGMEHLQTAESLLKALPKNLFDAQRVGHAQSEFTAASAAFMQVINDLKSLPEISTAIPVYGGRLSAALHLLPIAIELSQTGLIGCKLLNLIIARFHDPLKTQTSGLTMADFTIITRGFRQIKTDLTLIVNQVKHLQPADLQVDPHLNKYFTTFQKDVPQLQTGLEAVEQLLPVIPTLLGIDTPANYLVEVLDSTELRPGGGFIGNYGIVTFAGGRLTSAHITDTYLLDRAFNAAGHSIPYPSAYAWFDLSPSWSFRDSNLDADFPTAARYAELNYVREGGNIPVRGVIAITPALIQHVLEIIGPIKVPEYHETVTVQNLVDRIHYYQVGPGYQGGDVPSPDGNSSLRKHFTALLAEHFLARVRQVSSSTLPRLLQLMISSLRSKDVQMYLNPAIAEDLLSRYHIDATIQSSKGDSLFVVDANISPNKANKFITNTLNDQVTIDVNGNAIHHTILSYTWKTNGPVYGSNMYRDYVRVYVPPGSKLQVQNGWQTRGTSTTFRRDVWAGFFTLRYGQTDTITLVWNVPGAAVRDAKGWHYQYLLQRQAGAQWLLHLQITLPSCVVTLRKWGELISANRSVADLTLPLNEDVNAGIDYTC